MSERQPGATSLRRWLPIATPAFLALAAIAMLVLIPVVYQDPDATPDSSAIGSSIFAAVNVALAVAAFLARRSRGGLIAVAGGALVIGLLALDGVAAFSTHTRAPWLELPLISTAVGFDMVAALIAVLTAILGPHRTGATPRGSKPTTV